jgi:superfamily II DNA/RNA helicase
MFLKKLNEGLASAISDAGYETPTELQKKSISKIKGGGDVVCIGPENSGKTSALVIALIQKLNAALDDVPRALIVVPDKEAADAMKEKFDLLGKNTDLRVFCVYSKLNLNKLKDSIYLGSDVVIGTIKTLSELYSNNGLNLTALKYFVIDDAELSLRNEVISQVDRLSDSIPKSQYIVFAKKMIDRIERLADRDMNYPTIIEVEESCN